MNLTLSNNEVVEILTVDFVCQRVDWRRKTGYTGACVSSFSLTSLVNLEADLKIGHRT